MTINFECPACQKVYRVAAELAGKTSRCGCGHQFVIPTQSTHANLGSSQPSSQMPLANQAEMNDLSGLASPLRNSMSLSTPAPVTTTHKLIVTAERCHKSLSRCEPVLLQLNILFW